MRDPRIALVGLFLATGCQPAVPSDPGGPYTAQIITAIGDGAYDLRATPLPTLASLDGVSGTIGRVLVGADLDITSDMDEVIRSEEPDNIYLDRGHTPALQYEIADGVVKPLDFASLEILSTYHAFEVTHAWWTDSGLISAEEIGAPRMFYDPSLKYAGAGVAVELVAKVNAAFLPGPRDFWLFRTSRLEEIPLKVNLGVVAHEFGHLLFDSWFAERAYDIYDTDSSTSTEELNGLNEGLSDFFSYMVTGNEDEFAASMPDLAAERTLPVPWTLRTLPYAPCYGSYYCKGSLIASALHAIVKDHDVPVQELGAAVRDALAATRADWLTARDSGEFGYHHFINRVLDEAGEARTGWCATFKAWFDTDDYEVLLKCEP